MDFDAILALDSIDFGTFHLYPETWGKDTNGSWATQYIQDHVTAQEDAGKPVILEEYGLSTAELRDAQYPVWQGIVERRTWLPTLSGKLQCPVARWTALNFAPRMRISAPL